MSAWELLSDGGSGALRALGVLFGAPIDGAVARRHVNPGEFLNGNTAVFTIVQSDPLKWNGSVAEHAALKSGEPAAAVTLEQKLEGQKVVFAPDRHLGRYVAKQTGRDDVYAEQAALMVRKSADAPFERMTLLRSETATDARQYEGMLFDLAKPIEYYVEADGVRSPGGY